MKQMEVYVPLTDNQGHKVSGANFQHIENLLVKMFGGFSCYDVAGQWQYPDGRVQAEHCTVYRVVTKDDDYLLGAIKTLARIVKRMWQQESVLYTVTDLQAEFV